MPRPKRRTAPAKSTPTTNEPEKRSEKVLRRTIAVSDDELSEGGIAEMVHERSGGRWTAFAEREQEEREDEKPVAENGDDGAEDEDDEEGEDDEDMDEDVYVGYRTIGCCTRG